ncbi:MAG: oligoendopeptidase F [Anaerolineae bacterium]|jgi:oligoendopeptidase F|nr:oligoendopeptidase F [Anaerolineae bacterium]MBT7072481.1 oligoendopeptidase F [Anaerolineae bacterium]MBT7325548.1 oligoendopeptidase F [Anaerolineae bacterium]
MPKIPARSEVDPKYTWNAESVFASPEAWQAEAESIVADISSVKAFQGKLGESAASLADALEALENLQVRAERLAMYAGFTYSVDTADQNAAAMADKAGGVYGQVVAATSFLQPEMLEIGEQTLHQWVREEARLTGYEHFVSNLFRKQAHLRSSEVEEILGMLADPFGGASATRSMLTNADFKFPAVQIADGDALDLTQGTLQKILNGPDRDARKSAWNQYHDLYLAHKNTLASSLATSIKQNVFQMRARKHRSTLAASLFEDNINVDVFHNLISVFKKNLPVWQRYFEIRRKVLGVDELHPYDLWAPLTSSSPKLSYEQAVEWICEGLAPMGAEYVETVRKGALEDRWVDVYPNQGKRTGAFSWGAPGTHPFIMMSFGDNMTGLSTLAHELGHSMHSYLTWQNQPLVYGEYSLFVAEVASNFNQALVRGHLLKSNPDKNFQIAIIEEAMSNFLRYFFIMPTLARFELETHERAERGEALTADTMMTLMADLFAEGYGETVTINRERVGMIWSTFGHLFSDYYVYAYATGISGAHALSRRVLDGVPNAVEDYTKFLKAGASMYPLDALKMAGVDLTKPDAVEETFAVMSEYIDRLEKLTG